MIYFDASGTYPTSFLFNPLEVDASVNTMYPISGKPVNIVLTSNTIFSHTNIFTDCTGLINKCKAIRACIESNKEKLLLSEIGKFYYHGRKFLSCNALSFMVYNLPYITVNEEIYKQFNKDPEFYAKIISSKVGSFNSVHPAINSLEQIYSMGIYGYSKQTLLSNNSIISNNLLRSAKSVCWHRLVIKLQGADYSVRSILYKVSNTSFNSMRYHRALNLIETNKGLKNYFTPDSIASII